MANFEKALKKVLASEGGYSNDPDDIGRETYCGISRRFWPKWGGWEIIDEYKHPDGRNNSIIPNNAKFIDDYLSNLVGAFYLKYFWKPLKCYHIENQSVAESLFDHAVNAGKKPAVRLLQREINLYAVKYESLEEDGIMGPKTLGGIAAVIEDEPNFPNYFVQARIGEYFQKCYNSAIKFKWLNGWVRRCLKHIQK